MRRFAHTGRIADGQKETASGMTLIEVLIASVIMATALLALLVLAATAVHSNSRNRWDTGATLAAQMVMEHIASQGSAASAATITDCAGQIFTVNTGGATAGGAGAPLTAEGRIDFTSAAVAGYSTSTLAGGAPGYAVCEAGGGQTRYDVRWNVRTITTPSGVATYTNAITVAARPLGATNELRRFAIPVNLRRIVGPA